MTSGLEEGCGGAPNLKNLLNFRMIFTTITPTLAPEMPNNKAAKQIFWPRRSPGYEVAPVWLVEPLKGSAGTLVIFKALRSPEKISLESKCSPTQKVK